MAPFLLVLLIFETKIYLNWAAENQHLYEALNLIVENALVDNGNSLIVYANFNDSIISDRFNANEFINGVLQNINNATYEVLFQHQKVFYNFKHSEIVMVDNKESLKKYFKKQNPMGNMHFSKTLLFISSLRTLDYHTIYLIFKDMFYMDIVKISLVVHLAPDDIVLLTYFPFTPTSCRDFTPVIINHYIASENRWANMDYFPLKLNNFYGCPITCCTWNDMPYFSVKPDTSNTSEVDYIGIVAELLQLIALQLNFSVRVYWLDDDDIDINDEEASFSKLFSSVCDLVLSGSTYRKDLDNLSKFSQTNSFFLSHIFIVTNVVTFSTMYEKLTYPFHYSVWFTLGAICALISLLICICGQRRQWLKYRQFSIGPANKSPHFYLYIMVVGASMTTTQLPKRNFARFLLICWLMVTLILRSAYQSGMYKMLRTDEINNLPHTIANVFEQKYLISMTPENLRYLDILPHVNRQHILNTSILSALSELLNAQEPTALITPYEYYGYFVKMNESLFQHLHLVKENILTQQLTIYSNQYSIITQLNTPIALAHNYGFTAFWNRRYVIEESRVWEQFIDMSDLSVLSIDELSDVFMILVWLHVLSIGIFLIELIWHYVEVYLNHIKTFLRRLSY